MYSINFFRVKFCGFAARCSIEGAEKYTVAVRFANKYNVPVTSLVLTWFDVSICNRWCRGVAQLWLDTSADNRRVCAAQCFVAVIVWWTIWSKFYRIAFATATEVLKQLIWVLQSVTHLVLCVGSTVVVIGRGAGFTPQGAPAVWDSFAGLASCVSKTRLWFASGWNAGLASAWRRPAQVVFGNLLLVQKRFEFVTPARSIELIVIRRKPFTLLDLGRKLLRRSRTGDLRHVINYDVVLEIAWTGVLMFADPCCGTGCNDFAQTSKRLFWIYGLHGLQTA